MRFVKFHGYGNDYLVFEAAELKGVGLSAGFLAQSPTGEGCAATFDGLEYVARTLMDLRDGS